MIYNLKSINTRNLWFDEDNLSMIIHNLFVATIPLQQNDMTGLEYVIYDVSFIQKRDISLLGKTVELKWNKSANL